MHADLTRPATEARHDGRFPRAWLAAWLAPVLLCLIAALHFGSIPPPMVTAQSTSSAELAGVRP